MIINENELDSWVRANSTVAQGAIVELVWRLVSASSPQPKERRFPLGDSIGQHGPDGVLNAVTPFEPFIPSGLSYWEIGTGVNSEKKATSDYKDLVKYVPRNIRQSATFVFVTPLSGRRDWDFSWKRTSQADWIESRKKRNDWHDIRVIDGTKLIDWVHQIPPVELWMIKKMHGNSINHIETLEQRWNILRTIGSPPPLTTELFLSNRDEACDALNNVLDGTFAQLKLETHFQDQAIAFVAAYFSSLEDEKRVEAAGRWIIVSNISAWETLVAQQQKLTLVADPSLDLCGDLGTRLIQSARISGHTVIYSAPPGGIPGPGTALLTSPRTSQIQNALEKAGYNPERARKMSQHCEGNLGSLLRILQDLSLLPEWADNTAASELAIAELLGSWSDSSDADRLTAESLSGKAYGEWIGTMREVTLRPGTPLVQHEGNWKFVARYEGWFSLGTRIFDEHLERLQQVATTVLSERDPQFDLPRDERYAANIQGKVLSHSHSLRDGLANSLALIGSHPGALKSCSTGKAVNTAAATVRAILSGASWERWAGLNRLLPLLAEARPEEFLEAIELALDSDPCPFDRLFSEESGDVTGTTYISGILWGLETLAWNPDYFNKIVMCLGELSARDPGGMWNNRPANSLTTILLPWMPHTCSLPQQRYAVVISLLNEFPDTGWELILSLLPNSRTVSFGTHRPTWRNFIPDDWPKQPTINEYQEDIGFYTKLAISTAKNDPAKLEELIDFLETMTPESRKQLLFYLDSSDVLNFSEKEKLGLWKRLVNLISMHRRFSNAKWALPNTEVVHIESVADKLKSKDPALFHQRLFVSNDFDLFEEDGDYKQQRENLEKRRRAAVKEIVLSGGVHAILEFADSVGSPWRVGYSFGSEASNEMEESLLPASLVTEQDNSWSFINGFIFSRFSIYDWKWVDQISMEQWSPEQIGQFLACLPFEEGSWERAGRLLGADESSYWSRTIVNPYISESNLEFAVDKLIQHGRTNEALQCLGKLAYENQPFDSELGINALLASLSSSDEEKSVESHQLVHIINALQNNPDTDQDGLFRVEWSYLPLLDRFSRGSPKLLERKLANEPDFFCKMIGLMFGSSDNEYTNEEPTEINTAMATNAYKLLNEWRDLPGCQENGLCDDDFLQYWLEEVKKKCKETDRFEVAMSMIGQSFIHAPEDPDGLWIHRNFAKVLNTKDNNAMRDGFETGLYNSRGVSMLDPTGKPERELACQYREKSKFLETAGYSNLAATIRKLAETYEMEADKIRAENLT